MSDVLIVIDLVTTGAVAPIADWIGQKSSGGSGDGNIGKNVCIGSVHS